MFLAINLATQKNLAIFWLLIENFGLQEGGWRLATLVVILVAEGIGAHERDFKSQEKGRSQTSTVGDWFDRQAITNMLAKTFGMISVEKWN